MDMHACTLVLGFGHVQVVRAKDLDLDVEGLLMHGQGFLWLSLVFEHVSDAAQAQNRSHNY